MEMSLRSLEQGLNHKQVTDQAIQETAQKFRDGDVDGQSLTFPPSEAEFIKAAEHQQELIGYRDKYPRQKQIRHEPEPYRQSPGERVRMGFKMSVLSRGIGIQGGPDMVAKANSTSLQAMIDLADMWKVTVPDEVRRQAVDGTAPPPRAPFIPPAVAKLKAKYAGRKVLHEGVSNERAHQLSQAGELPVGATYVAALATIFE
jgi:hypothetical protein